MMLGSALQAADWQVSPSGSDLAAGTAAAPWKTIQKAANTAQPGDTVTIRAGTYYELVSFNLSGTSGQPIVFKAASGEQVILDGSQTVWKKQESKALLSLIDRSYVTVEGLELRNLRTSQKESVPMGIYIGGSGKGLVLRNNKVHHIEQTATKSSGVDAHGIAVYGDSATPIEDLLIKGNEVSDCLLGSSEALVVNGNVKGFAIRENTVHDCNNIGIDVIGFEGTCPDPAQDRARDGVVEENHVYNIDTFYNPAYGGRPGKGGGERSAAGIYVDGGQNLVVERNHVFHCDFGVELASEWPQGAAEDIVLRSNVVHHNLSAGLIMGGYDPKRGKARRIEVLNNTFYQNDRLQTWAGQMMLQYYVSDLRVENNIFWVEPGNRQVLVHEPYGKKATAAQKEIGPNVAFDYNRFYDTGGSAALVTFSLFKGGQQRYFTGLAEWQGSPLGLQGDAHSSFGNPVFGVSLPPLPTAKPTLAQAWNIADAYRLSPISPCINAGNPSYAADPGEMCFFGDSRVAVGRVDIGADED
jgi:hypothetical protein